MRQLLVRVIAAAVTFACALPVTAHAQTPTSKALVYCPTTIDGSGCDHVVTALAGTFASVDRAYDGTNGTINLASADINHYAVFLVPSLADGTAKPYALLRDPAIAARLKTVAAGRIAVWSGTPDQGDANRDLKNRLIQNLASWAGQPYGTSGVMGTVILQDLSADPTQRYGWLSGISSITVTADTSLDVYDSVAVLTPGGKTILDNAGVQLAYASMASYGLHFANGNAPLAGALGGSSNRQIVLATYDGATDGIASVKTDKADYVPGETATITGSGWGPGETVTMVLHEDPEVHDNRTLTSVADGQGNFVNTQLVLEPHDLGVKFLLTALGATSGRSAQTTFTDGNSTVSGTIRNIVTGSPIAGATITCTTTSGCNNTFSTTSASNGTYSFQVGFANPTATVVLTASAAGFTANTRNVPLTNGTTVTGIDISLTPATSIIVANVSGTFGGVASLSATLTSGSSPVSGKIIGFKVNGTSVGTATTGSLGVATLSVSLSGINVGTYSGAITATFAGDASFTGSTGTGSLTVNPASQTIVFTSTPPASAAFGGPAYTVTATGGASGNPVTFSIQSGSSCTLTTPNIVNMAAAGNCTVIASQAGNGNYTAASDVQQTFIIGKASQTISFASLSPKTLGDAPFTVSATASSGLPVTFAVGATDQCTIAAATVSITGVGSCTVTASQAGNANYNVAANVPQTFSISAAQPTVSITSDTPDPSQYGQPVTVQFTVTGPPSTPAPTGTVSVSDGTASCSAAVAAGSCSLTFTTVGSTTLTATYSGDQNFLKTASTGEPHQVTKAATHTVVTAHTPDPVSFGQPITISVSVSASTATPPGGSAAVSLIGDADRATCNAPLTNGAGSCTITPPSVGAKIILATFPGDANFNESTSQSVTQQVGQSTQTITFAALPDKKLGDAAFSVSATASSGLPVSFAVGASDQCTISGSTVTLTAAGNCTVTASQSGNTTYAPAANVAQTFAIAKGDAAVAITADTPDPSQYGQAISVAFTVTPPAGTPTPTGNVTVSDGVTSCTAAVAAGSCSLTPSSAGAKTLTATYAGDANFGNSVSAGEPHQVNKAAVRTLITAHTPDPVPLGQSVTITVSVTSLTATATPPVGGVAVSLLGPTPADYTSCNATLTNGTGSCSVTPPTAGNRTLQATFPGDANYGENSSPVVTQQVGQAPQTITFAALTNKTFGDPSFTVSATASSGLPVAFAVGATDQCTIAGSTVSLTGAGSCTVTASQGGNATYQPAPAESQTFQIGKASSAIAITSHTPNPSQVGQAVTIAYAVTGVTGGVAPTGNVTVTDGPSSCTATVAAGACPLTLTSAGSKTLTATYAGDNNYSTSVSSGVSHQVNPAAQTITFAALPDKKVTDAPFTVTATASSGLSVSFAVGATDQCRISGNTVTVTGAGSCTVTASQSGNVDFAAAPNVSQTFTITKSQATVAITADTPDPSQFGQAVNVAFTVSGGAGAPAATGNVTVSDGSASCTATVAAGSCPLTLTTIGARTLTATYAGDANFSNSVSPGEPHQVNKGPVQTLITAHTPDPVVVGQPLTVSVSVSSATAVSPSGSVAVSLLGPTPADYASCNATLANGVGSCSLTPPTAGSRTLQATFPGDANYGENSSPVVTQQVGQAPQTITFAALTNKIFGDPSFTVSATASSGLPVTFAVGATDQCTIAGSTVSLTGAGSCTVTASQAGNGTYQAAPSASQTFQIGKASSAIAVTSHTPSPSQAGQGVTIAYAVTGVTGGVAPNGNVTVTDGVASCTGTVATGTCSLTITSAGLKTLTATYAGDNNYLTSVSQGVSHQVNPAPQTIAFAALVDRKLGDAAFSVSATASSGLPVSFAVGASDQCTISGSTVTLTAAGNCTVTASQSGNTTYAPAANVAQTFTIAKGDAAVAITADTPDPSQYGQAISVAFTVTPPAGTPTPTGNVTVSDGSASCTATVAAGSCALTLTTVGARSLTATYGGDVNFGNSVSAAEPHQVNKGAARTIITAHTPDPAVVGQPVAVSVSVSSQTAVSPSGSVAVSLLGPTPADNASCNATLTNGAGSCSLTPPTAGSRTLQATFPGDANYGENSSPVLTTLVGKAPASVTLVASTLNQTYDGHAKLVQATTSVPGLNVVIGYTQNSVVVTSPTAAGSYDVTATIQDQNYSGSASGTLVIGKASATLTIADVTHTYNGAPQGVTVTTSPAGLTGVSVSYAGVATTPTDAGSYQVTATLDNPNYVANPATATLKIAKATAAVTLSNLEQTYDGTGKLPTVSTTPPNLHVTLVFGEGALSNSNPVNAGSYPFIATIDDNNYEGSANGTLVIVKAAATTTITSHAPSPSVFGQAVTVAVSVTSSTTGIPTGSVTVSLSADGASCSAALTNGSGSCSLVPQSAGAKTINASFTGDANFSDNTSAPVSHTVGKASASITFANLNQTYDGSPKIVTAATTPENLSGLTITYGGSPTPPTNAGSYTINATLDNPNYSLAPATATLTVNPAAQSITFASLPARSYGDAAFAVTATASSGLAVAFSASGQCTVSGGQVTLTGAGSCSITASQAGGGNFAAAPDVTRSFTIAKATLSASANSAQMVYGDALPSLSGAVTGVVNGDGITAAFTTAATRTSAVGSYAIVPQLQDPNGKLTNYTVALTNGALTITPADLSATANDATRVYGTANPTFSGTLTGLRNNDAITLSFSTTATAQSSAGTYSIVPSLSDPDHKLGNYTVRSLTNGTLTITKATATLSLSNLSQVYTGNALPVTVTTTPAGLNGVSVTYNGSPTAPTNAGQYAVVATLTNDNYSASQISGTLSIAPASQTITLVTPAAATYGDPPIAVTASATSGLPIAVTVTGPCSISGLTLTITGAGSCVVTAAQNGNANYQAAAPVSRTIAVSKATASVTLGNLTQTYDGSAKQVSTSTTPSALNVTVEYKLNGVTVTNPTNAGSYAVTATVVNDNYQGGASGTLVIAPALLSIVWNAPTSPLKDPATLTSTQLNATVVRPNGTTAGSPDYYYAGSKITALPFAIQPGLGQAVTAKYTSTDPNFQSPTDVTRTFDVFNAMDFLTGNPFNTIALSDTKTTEYTAAFLGTADFDVRTIDPATALLGDGNDSPADAAVNKNADGTLRYSITDVNGDGKPDLLLYFNRAAVNASGITTATTQMVLRATTSNGRKLRATDKVTVSP